MNIHRVSEKKLDPLLLHHIFALTATNCMNISRSTCGVVCCKYEINICDLLTMNYSLLTSL